MRMLNDHTRRLAAVVSAVGGGLAVTLLMLWLTGHLDAGRGLLAGSGAGAMLGAAAGISMCWIVFFTRDMRLRRRIALLTRSASGLSLHGLENATSGGRRDDLDTLGTLWSAAADQCTRLRSRLSEQDAILRSMDIGI